MNYYFIYFSDCTNSYEIHYHTFCLDSFLAQSDITQIKSKDVEYEKKIPAIKSDMVTMEFINKTTMEFNFPLKTKKISKSLANLVRKKKATLFSRPSTPVEGPPQELPIDELTPQSEPNNIEFLSGDTRIVEHEELAAPPSIVLSPPIGPSKVNIPRVGLDFQFMFVHG